MVTASRPPRPTPSSRSSSPRARRCRPLGSLRRRKSRGGRETAAGCDAESGPSPSHVWYRRHSVPVVASPRACVRTWLLSASRILLRRLTCCTPAHPSTPGVRHQTGAHLFADVLPCVGSLRAAGLCVGAVTDGNAHVQRDDAVAPLFDFSVSATEAGATKEGLAPHLMAAAASSCHPSQVECGRRVSVVILSAGWPPPPTASSHPIPT